jgi:hypothetical protein
MMKPEGSRELQSAETNDLASLSQSTPEEDKRLVREWSRSAKSRRKHRYDNEVRNDGESVG